MRTNQQFELLEHPTITSIPARPSRMELVKRIWASSFCSFLASSDEPRFCKVLDKNGQSSWKVYDPAKDEIFYLSSLEVVLEWIEERHHPTSQISCFYV